MNDLERILNDIPDHELRATKFRNEVSNLGSKYPSLKFDTSFAGSSGSGPNPFIELMESIRPGTKDDYADIEHELEIRSVDETSVYVDIEGSNQEIVETATENMRKIAVKYNGVENPDLTEHEDRSQEYPWFLATFCFNFT